MELLYVIYNTKHNNKQRYTRICQLLAVRFLDTIVYNNSHLHPSTDWKIMKDLYGTYQGLMLSDESEVGWCETRLIIDDTAIVMTIATGLELQDERWESPKDEMSTGELSAQYHGADVPDGVRGFAIEGTDLRLIFTPVVDDERAIILLGLGMEEFVGPTYYFSSETRFNTMVAAVEKENNTPGAVPLIATGGLAPNQM